MPEIKVGFSIYGDGTVYQSKGRSEHIDKEYSLIEDNTDKAGRRTIILQEKDLTLQKEKARKLANLIADRIGEGSSKTFKEMLYDIFKDYYEKTLDKLVKRVEKGEPVKVKEGCFKILIGDGRTKKSECIMLRD
jgi:hypothetical protein